MSKEIVTEKEQWHPLKEKKCLWISLENVE